MVHGIKSLKRLISPAAHNTDLPQSSGPGGEHRLRSLDKQLRLHKRPAHNSTHPRDQRQHSDPLQGGPTLLRLPVVPAGEVPQQVRVADTQHEVCFSVVRLIGVFVVVGRTGTFLLQECLLVLRWSSAFCPKRRRDGGRSK